MASNVYKCKIWPTGSAGDYHMRTYERQSDGVWIEKFGSDTKGSSLIIEEQSGWLYHSFSGVWAGGYPEVIGWSINKKTGEFYSARTALQKSGSLTTTQDGICMAF